MNIIWSLKALYGFEQIVNYLESSWTEKEVSAFVRDVSRFLVLLSENPQMLQKSPTQKNLYRGPINRLTILTYQLNSKTNTIELVNIKPAKQRPPEE